MYSWLAFVISNIVVELPYQMFLGITAFASYYYAVFGIQSSERQGLILLFLIQNFVFACTFAQMIIADQFLAGNRVYWSDRWRNFGILFAFIVFNMLATIGLYWLARVRPLREKGTSKFSKKVKAWSMQFALWVRIFFVRDAGEDKTGREAKVDKLY
jgi:ABC-type multidrug transport system permease subunit